MNKLHIIILLIFLIIILYYILNKNTSEHFAASDNEAIQNIASLYNTDNMKITNLTVSGQFNLLPTGIIVAWAGSNVPTGWLLCDGTNGTPDLRSRFVIGAGQGVGLSSYAPGSKGGEETHLLTIDEMPAHNHPLQLDNACFHNGGCDARQSINYNNGPGNNTMNTGGGKPHNNMPPYFALAYIMKS